VTRVLAYAFVIVSFALQGVAMIVDELVYHRRRGLPRWERIGHPIDTLADVLCFVWLLARAPTRENALVYAGLAAVSSFLITKDERVHARECVAAEHWLHSVLFVLHPTVLIATGWLWWTGRGTTLIAVVAVLATVFGLHQLLYWNVPWRRLLRVR
jgi:hypothetical protein